MVVLGTVIRGVSDLRFDIDPGVCHRPVVPLAAITVRRDEPHNERCRHPSCRKAPTVWDVKRFWQHVEDNWHDYAHCHPHQPVAPIFIFLQHLLDWSQLFCTESHGLKRRSYPKCCVSASFTQARQRSDMVTPCSAASCPMRRRSFSSSGTDGPGDGGYRAGPRRCIILQSSLFDSAPGRGRSRIL